MSKLTKIQNQYKGFVAAMEAVKNTNPEKIEVVYGNDESDPGIFIYDPENDGIYIYSNGQSPKNIFIYAKDIPALIKALREFVE